MTRVPPGLVLALHPNRRGFGWILFEGPFSPYDWGTAVVSRDKHAESVRRVVALIDQYTPETLVLEVVEGSARERATRLLKAVAAIAAERAIELALYAKEQVKACFATVGAASRQDIAEAIGRSLPALQRLVPKPRRAWEKEPHHMSLFSAAALGLVHFQLGASRLFNTL